MLVLFDIDGTLLKRLPNEEGSHRISTKEEAFMVMVKKLWSLDRGLYTSVIGKNLRGMTDFEIILELTTRMGVTRNEVLERMQEVKRVLIDEFDRLESTRKASSEYEVLPGVRELLSELRELGVKLGLATGNLKHFATYKLELLGLDRFFSMGGFGDDSLERSEIVAGAVKEGNEEKSYLVGDTPRDILAAQACDIGVVAVATGGHSYEELASYSPGLLVRDLTDRRPVLDYFGLSSGGIE
jgi:HAD superfamily hydrolase (TIGR01549 family)